MTTAKSKKGGDTSKRKKGAAPVRKVVGKKISAKKIAPRKETARKDTKKGKSPASNKTKAAKANGKGTKPGKLTAASPLNKGNKSKAKPVAVKHAQGAKKATNKKVPPAAATTQRPELNGKQQQGKGLRLSPPPKVGPVSPPPRPVAKSPPPKPTNPKVVKQIRDLQSVREQKKDLSQPIFVRPPVGKNASDISAEPTKDRLVLVVRDSYWLHASWEITRRSVERAKAAMAEHWHTVRPILRVLKIDKSGTTNNAETIYQDIEIHSGVRNWYIDVSDPPNSFRVLLGYVAGNGRFHEIARSNSVSTPTPGSTDAISEHWADIAHDAEHVFAISGGYQDEQESTDLREMFEERLNRPMGAPALAQFGSGAEAGFRRHRHFHFDLDAEMVIFGSTHPDAYVTLSGEPVKVRSDGTFSVHVPLPDRRQVLAATACTRDGVDEQTIVIAVERNTKVMEPLSKENGEDQG